MASPVLHVKDAYYFDVPKALWPVDYESRKDFPEWWVKLDADFLEYQAELVYGELKEIAPEFEIDLPAKAKLIADFEHWQHAEKHHHGHSFASYLEREREALEQEYESSNRLEDSEEVPDFSEYLEARSSEHAEHGDAESGEATHLEHLADVVWFAKAWENEAFREEWESIVAETSSSEAVEAYVENPGHKWSPEKIDAYNRNLSGKVIIPQPFGGELTNLYEGKGLLVSKFMVIQVVVALLLAALFIGLARAVEGGRVAKGRLRNLLEVFLVFMRDEVAKPAIGHDAAKYVPFLWTVFLFVLFLNLAGMVPWVGSPTASFAVTTALAAVTFVCVVIAGMSTFGPVGFFKNLVPSIDLPVALAVILLPVIFVIELASFLIKHAILSVRLLANMVAGHLVLAGIMGVAFTYEAAIQHTDFTWSLAGVIAVVGATVFSLLELFVAFLQAYVFTFLSALFIGSVVHEH